MKSALNTSFPRYLGPAALFMAHLALAVVYKTWPGCIIGLGTVLSGIGTYSTTELEKKKKRPLTATSAHYFTRKKNCQLAFALSRPVWLSGRAIIVIQPWVRLELQGETKSSCVITFSSAFP